MLYHARHPSVGVMLVEVIVLLILVVAVAVVVGARV